MCLYVIYLASHNLYRLVARKGSISDWLPALCVYQILTMLSFLYNQSVWLMDSHESAIGITASVSWLAYDYLNTLFHIAAASSVRQIAK